MRTQLDNSNARIGRDAVFAAVILLFCLAGGWSPLVVAALAVVAAGVFVVRLRTDIDDRLAAGNYTRIVKIAATAFLAAMVVLAVAAVANADAATTARKTPAPIRLMHFKPVKMRLCYAGTCRMATVTRTTPRRVRHRLHQLRHRHRHPGAATARAAWNGWFLRTDYACSASYNVDGAVFFYLRNGQYGVAGGGESDCPDTSRTLHTEDDVSITRSQGRLYPGWLATFCQFTNTIIGDNNSLNGAMVEVEYSCYNGQQNADAPLFYQIDAGPPFQTYQFLPDLGLTDLG